MIDYTDRTKDTPRTVNPYHPFKYGNKDDDMLTPECEDFEHCEVYVWRECDRFLRKWFRNHGYKLKESVIFEDCIGYHCIYLGQQYKIFMFAHRYNEGDTAQMNGEYCAKLFEYDFLKPNQAKTLVAFMDVIKGSGGVEWKYDVACVGMVEYDPIQFSSIARIKGKYRLLSFDNDIYSAPLFKLIYAFNNDDAIIYDDIIEHFIKAHLEISGEKVADGRKNVIEKMIEIHKKYGDMKIGYAKDKELIAYYTAPYIEEYGYFIITLWSGIYRIEIRRFDSKDMEKIEDFIYRL